MTLTEFLLARLDEDEAEALAAGGGQWEEYALDSGDAGHIARHDPARVLAEVGAKRRIVEKLTPEGELRDWFDYGAPAWGVLTSLASVYSDHADFREDWAS